MIHRENVEHYPGSVADLAAAVANLRYDALATFLRGLADKLAVDASADEARGRVQLATALRKGAGFVAAAAGEIERAWGISAPHM